MDNTINNNMIDCCQNLAANMIAIKEKILMRAVEYKLGKGFDKENLKGRGAVHIYPDGREVFSVDGEELVEFYPPKFDTLRHQYQPQMTAAIDYKELYKK